MISFRNHTKTKIEFNNGLTVIWGKNGTGKTSILEAIHGLSLGKSFKTTNKKELIKKGEANFYLKGVFRNERNEKNTVSFSQDTRGIKKIRINNKEILKRKEMLGLNNVVVFSPEEEEITKGPAGERRKYFNRVFSICSPPYLESLLSYNKILKQRNTLLKSKKQKTEALEIWNEPMAIFGEKLWSKRNKEIEEIRKIFKKTAKNFDSKLEIDIKYKTKIKNKNEIISELYKNQKLDIKRGFTSFGPHRDEILFFWENKIIRKHGSQGEHKLFLVLLKITEYIYISKKTKTTPVFLIDDMFASLDRERSKKILDFIGALRGLKACLPQTIVTTTDADDIKKQDFSIGNTKITKYQLKQNGIA